jgi:hypothetical protein
VLVVRLLQMWIKLCHLLLGLLPLLLHRPALRLRVLLPLLRRRLALLLLQEFAASCIAILPAGWGAQVTHECI